MSAAVVCTPLAVERAAVAPALPTLPVIRTGAGSARSLASAARADIAGRPLAVAGLAGAVHPELEPGDIIVASELRGPGGPVACPAAPLAAASLRRLGLPVRVGALHSSTSVVHGSARSGYAAAGALAVDMESAPLAAAAGTEPVLAVRVVVDTPRHPLLRPGTVARGVRALRRLRAAAAVIADWDRALGARELVVGGADELGQLVETTRPDLVLLAGLGSAGQRLAEQAGRDGVQVRVIDDACEVELGWLAGASRVGVLTGAAAPRSLVDDLAATLAGLGPLTLRSPAARGIGDEHFRLAQPGEVA